MTDKTNTLSACRAEFEAWARPDQVQNRRDESGAYTEPGMAAAWGAWQAAWNRRATPAPAAAQAPSIDYIMEAVQCFASEWSLVGGRCDRGGMLEQAEATKARIRRMFATQAAPSPQEPVAVAALTDGKIYEWAEGFQFSEKGNPHKMTFSRAGFIKAVRAIIREAMLAAAPAHPIAAAPEAASDPDTDRMDWIIENCTTQGGGRGFDLSVWVPFDSECIRHAIDAVIERDRAALALNSTKEAG